MQFMVKKMQFLVKKMQLMVKKMLLQSVEVRKFVTTRIFLTFLKAIRKEMIQLTRQRPISSRSKKLPNPEISKNFEKKISHEVKFSKYVNTDKGNPSGEFCECLSRGKYGEVQEIEAPIATDRRFTVEICSKISIHMTF